MTNPVRVIIFKEGDLWVAQCLEYDIGAQAGDLDTLHSRVYLAMETERRTSKELLGTEFAGIGPAPPHFYELWDKRAKRFHAATADAAAGVKAEYALCA